MLARAFAGRHRAAVLSHDRYYRSVRPGQPRPNFDHPDSLDTAALLRDLAALRGGQEVRVPVYDFATHRQQPRETWESLAPSPLLLVEGIHVLAVPPLRAVLDVRVFVYAPDDVRLARRLRRDVVHRGRTMADVLDQYEQTVRPMHQRFVEPSTVHAGLVLDGTQPVDVLADQLAAFLERSS